MEADGGLPLGLILAAGLLCGAALVVASPAAAIEGAPSPFPIAVLDLVYVDTSGEVRDQTQEHAARIRHFADALRSDLERSGKFRIVTAQCGSAPCLASGEPSELLARAREAGAKLVLIGGIHSGRRCRLSMSILAGRCSTSC